MFRSEAHFQMLANLRFLELQKLLLNRFQIFKNEEISILKKDSMKSILYEWAKFLTKEEKKTNMTHIPNEVLQNKKVVQILRDNIDCRWLVNKINIKGKNSDDDHVVVEPDVLKKLDKLHFDEYPNLFYYEYPQFPYNYYDKKKMTNFYSLIKFPYNDILNISKMTKNDQNLPDNIEEDKKKHLTGEVMGSTNVDVVHTQQVNYSSNSYIYSPSEIETSKENYYD
ncbi:hypothetical protein, conserved [Plasmodium gonderi]|uniref:Uncharacterized protein n=1 Tax=Plasmodium gonderi TaxID=77519 RepID=A0A1Y1JIT3_PLAGO|nr:hypothetical protein, conserved [Plasmodium gonderi]GAW80692.1 hypothetical protein, conserved [Plasmodium gonderi]